MVAKKTKRAAWRLSNTDAEVRGMMTQRALWMDRLRMAATERGCVLPSVAEFARVYEWLDATVAKKGVQ
jgi:hypothetical protein